MLMPFVPLNDWSLADLICLGCGDNQNKLGVLYRPDGDSLLISDDQAFTGPHRYTIRFNLAGSGHQVTCIPFAKALYDLGAGPKQSSAHLGIGANRKCSICIATAGKGNKHARTICLWKWLIPALRCST